MVRHKKRTSKNARSGENKKKSSNETNLYDVLIRFIDAVYDLAQTGNLILLTLFFGLSIFFTLALKMPSEAVPGLFGGLGSFLTAEKFYIFPMLAVIGVQAYALYRQRRTYGEEIKRLTDHRTKVVHGLESGELRHLENHNTSGFDINNDTSSYSKKSQKDKV